MIFAQLFFIGTLLTTTRATCGPQLYENSDRKSFPVVRSSTTIFCDKGFKIESTSKKTATDNEWEIYSATVVCQNDGSFTALQCVPIVEQHRSLYVDEQARSSKRRRTSSGAELTGSEFFSLMPEMDFSSWVASSDSYLVSGGITNRLLDLQAVGELDLQTVGDFPFSLSDTSFGGAFSFSVKIKSLNPKLKNNHIFHIGNGGTHENKKKDTIVLGFKEKTGKMHYETRKGQHLTGMLTTPHEFPVSNNVMLDQIRSCDLEEDIVTLNIHTQIMNVPIGTPVEQVHYSGVIQEGAHGVLQTALTGVTTQIKIKVESGTFNSNQRLIIGDWVLVQLIHHANGNVEIFWNGILQVAGMVPLSYEIKRKNWFIGRSQHVNSDVVFHGKMKEMRFFKDSNTNNDYCGVSHSEYNTCAQCPEGKSRPIGGTVSCQKCPCYDPLPDGTGDNKEHVVSRRGLGDVFDQWYEDYTMQLFMSSRAKVVKQYGNIEDWDVSQVTNMESLFHNLQQKGTSDRNYFNADLSKWNTGKVRTMKYMFREAQYFNTDVSKWDVSQVENMESMFDSAYLFNGDISKWQTSRVKTMSYMFYDEPKFNADISRWDVSNVHDMQLMFNRALAFNADLSNWDVTNMDSLREQQWTNAAKTNVVSARIESKKGMYRMFKNSGFKRTLCGGKWQEASKNSGSHQDPIFVALSADRGGKGRLGCCSAGTYMKNSMVPEKVTNPAPIFDKTKACELCPIGYYGSSIENDDANCKKCPSGKYSTAEGSVSCGESCPSGKFNLPASSSDTSCVENCDPGTFRTISTIVRTDVLDISLCTPHENQMLMPSEVEGSVSQEGVLVYSCAECAAECAKVPDKCDAWEITSCPIVSGSYSNNNILVYTQHSTEQYKIGSSSVKFEGYEKYHTTGSTDHLSVTGVAGVAGFAPGTGDFSVEAWIYPTRLDVDSGLITIATSRPSGQATWTYLNTDAYVFGTRGNGALLAYSDDFITQSPTGTVKVGEWQHVAMVRDNGIVRLYRNGLEVASAANTQDFTSNSTYTIGAVTHLGGAPFSGYMDEIRVSSICRYPDGTTFTPTVVSFLDDIDTVFLVHSDTADGSTVFSNPWCGKCSQWFSSSGKGAGSCVLHKFPNTHDLSTLDSRLGYDFAQQMIWSVRNELCDISLLDENGCEKCKAGTFDSIAGSSSCEGICPTGKFNVPGSKSVSSCGCAPGKYSNGDSICETCPVGRISKASSTSLSSCVYCQKGTYSIDSIACQDCPEGKSNSPGSSSCGVPLPNEYCPLNPNWAVYPDGYHRCGIRTIVDEWLRNGMENKAIVTARVWDTSKQGKWTIEEAEAKDYGKIQDWDVSHIKAMSGLFNFYGNEDYKKMFNADLSRWETSEVVTMKYTFYDARSFNSDLSKWNIAKVVDTSNMFSRASVFDADISKWDVSKIRDASSMFYIASKFNSDLSKWKFAPVPKVTLQAAFDVNKPTLFPAIGDTITQHIQDKEATGIVLSYSNSITHIQVTSGTFENFGAFTITPVNIQKPPYVYYKSGKSRRSFSFSEPTDSVPNIGEMFQGSGFTRSLCGGVWKYHSSSYNYVNPHLGCCPSGKYMSHPKEFPFSEANSCSFCPEGRFGKIEWELVILDSNTNNDRLLIDIKEKAGVTVSQNEWTFIIEPQIIDAVDRTQGRKITQGSATGILKFKLVSDYTNTGTKTVVITAANGVSFVSNEDIIIGSTTVYHTEIITAINSISATGTLKTSLTGLTRNVVIEAAFGVTFVKNSELIIGQTSVPFSSVRSATVGNDDAMEISCFDCAPGTFTNNKGNVVRCEESCPAGKSNVPGSKNVASCTQGCSVGKFSTAGSGCLSCDQGKYSNITSAGSCLGSCAAGTSNVPGSTSNSSCQSCHAGRYSGGGSSCEKCPQGKSNSMASTHISSCKNCDKGKFSVSGSSCFSCPVGKSNSAGSSSCGDPIPDCEPTQTHYRGVLKGTSERKNVRCGIRTVLDVWIRNGMKHEESLKTNLVWADSTYGQQEAWCKTCTNNGPIQTTGIYLWRDYGKISDWDVSRIINMAHLCDASTTVYPRTIKLLKTFNADISRWDISRVGNMHAMFRDCSKFNSDVSRWSTGKVRDMSNTFTNALAFNSDISDWNVAAVVKGPLAATSISLSTSFDGDLSKWVFSEWGNGRDYKDHSDLVGGSFKRSVCGDKWKRIRDDHSKTSYGRYGCCPAGSYMSDPFFNDFFEPKSCSLCSVAGRFTSIENDETRCYDCPSGKFSSIVEGSTSCEGLCPAGKSNVPGSTNIDSCFDCSFGRYSIAGAPCKICAKGEEFISKNLPCKICEINTFSDNIESNCQNCPVGKWSTHTGSSSCGIPLPDGGYKNPSSVFNVGSFHEVIDKLLSEDIADQNDVKEVYGNIEDWDVSRVTNMQQLFQGRGCYRSAPSSSINSDNHLILIPGRSHLGSSVMKFLDFDISKWDVAQVISMESMFEGSTNFNGDLSKWSTGNVVNMKGMFSARNSYEYVFGTVFNGDISKWDVSKVESIVTTTGSSSTDSSMWKHSYYQRTLCPSKWISLPTSERTALKPIFGKIGCCSPGSYLFDTGGITCRSCPKGYKGSPALNDNYSCQHCSPGKFSNSTGSTVCNKCPIGKTSPSGSTSISSCQECEIGQFTTSEGSSNCQKCVAGKIFVSNLLPCKSCDAGKYGSSDGLSCLECPDGKFNTAGSTSCGDPLPNGNGKKNMIFTSALTVSCDGDYCGELIFDLPHGLEEGTVVTYTDNSVKGIEGLVDGATYYVLASSRVGKPNYLGDQMKLEATLGSGFIPIRNGQGARKNRISHNVDRGGIGGLVDRWIDLATRASVVSRYGNIEDWDVSQVTNMKNLFYDKIMFNADISRWIISKVTDMSFMFVNAIEFNSDLSKWDLSSIGTASYFGQDSYPNYGMKHIFGDSIYPARLENSHERNAINLRTKFTRTLCNGKWLYVQEYHNEIFLYSNGRLGCCPVGSYMSDPFAKFSAKSIFNGRSDFAVLYEKEPFSISKSCTTCKFVPGYGSWTENDDTSCQLCPVGRYSGDSNTCQGLCVAGKSSAPGSSSISDCQDCAQGLYSLRGSSCKNCPLGKLIVSKSVCRDCEKGKYGSSDGLTCSECPVGKFNSAGSTTCGDSLPTISGIANPTFPLIGQSCAKSNSCSTLREVVKAWFVDRDITQKKYGKMEDWDVSRVTRMSDLFKYMNFGVSRNVIQFPDLSRWNTKKVTRMDGAFSTNGNINIDVSKWDVSNVVDMERMFENCAAFNGDVSKWDVSKVMKMNYMFRGNGGQGTGQEWITNPQKEKRPSNHVVSTLSTLFNGDLSKWNLKRYPQASNRPDMVKILAHSGFRRTMCGPGWSNLWKNEQFGSDPVSFGRYGCCPPGSFMAKPMLHPFSVETACEICQLGQFGSNFENAHTTCTNCPQGRFSETALNSCSGICPQGKSSLPGSQNILDCNECPIGLVSSSDGSECQNCNLGKLFDTVSKNCINCEAGKFGTVDGCLSCADGKSNSAGSTTCGVSLPVGVGALKLIVDDWMITGNREANEVKYGKMQDWDVSKITDMKQLFYNKDILWNVDITSQTITRDAGVTVTQGVGGATVTGILKTALTGSTTNLVISTAPGVSFVSGIEIKIGNAAATTIVTLGNANTVTNTVPILPDLNRWNMASVTTTEEMFSNCEHCNVDVTNWNVSNIVNMNSMFHESLAFNGDVSKWDVSNVLSMDQMFSISSATVLAKFPNSPSGSITKFKGSVTSGSNILTVTDFNDGGFVLDDLNIGATVGSGNQFDAGTTVTEKRSTNEIVLSNAAKTTETDVTLNFYEQSGDGSNFNSDVSHWVLNSAVSKDNIFLNSGFKRTVCGNEWAVTMNGVGSNGRIGCCPAGTYIIDEDLANDFSIETSCNECPIGFYGSDSENSDKSCTSCPAGKLNTDPRSTSVLTCKNCDAGKYIGSDSSVSNCKNCDIGKSSTAGSSECLLCASGRVVASQSPLLCSICSAGKYLNASTLQCSDCVGTYILDNGINETLHGSINDCKFCPIGTFFVSTVEECQICSAGQYQSKSNVAGVICEQCNGTYLLDDGRNENLHGSIDNCQFCPIGTFFVSTVEECQICGAGKYQSKSNVAGVICEQCNGTYLLDDGHNQYEHSSIDNCKFCTAGTEFRNSTHLCEVCSYSKYQNKNNLANIDCKTCPKNTYINDDKILSNAHAAESDCFNCAIGKFNDLNLQQNPVVTCDGFVEDFFCKTCSMGKELNIITNKCKSCLAGQFSKITNKIPYCRICPVGYQSSGTSSSDCNPCMPGEYQTEKGASQCLKCPKNTKSENEHSTVCVSCPIGTGSKIGSRTCGECSPGRYKDEINNLCVVCGQGKYRGDQDNSTTCLDCAAGFFSNAYQSNMCLRCIPGRYQNNLGQTVCKICPKNTMSEMSNAIKCLDCVLGKSSDEESNKCRSCVVGKYNNIVGQDCKECDAGYYRNTKHDDSTICVACAKGRYQDKKGQAICNTCIPGKFGNVTGLIYNCDDCLADTFTSDIAQIICKKCPKGKGNAGNKNGNAASCGNCPAGKRLDESTQACLECLEGTYQPFVGKIECYDCPSGFAQPLNASTVCFPCIPGLFQPQTKQTSCKMCEKNYYTNQTKQIECSVCGVGKSSAIGSAQCQACLPGSAGSPCKECQTTQYRGRSDSPLQCLTCKIGQTSDRGSDVCQPCDIARYGSSPGVCLKCPVGFFTDGRGKTECSGKEACGVGKVPSEARSGCERPEYTLKEDCKLQTEVLDDISTNVNDHECILCPLGGDCSNPTTLSNLKPLDGYIDFSWADTYHPFAECPFPNSCLNNTCAIGYSRISDKGDEVPLCATCGQDYVFESSRCQLCNAEYVSVKITTVFIAIIILIVCIHASRKVFRSCQKKYRSVWHGVAMVLSIQINFAQIGGSLPDVFTVKWPTMYLLWLDRLSFLQFDILSMVGLTCLPNMTYELKFLCSVGIVVIIVLSIFIMYKIRMKALKESWRNNSIQSTNEVTHMIEDIFDIVDLDHSGNIDAFELSEILLYIEEERRKIMVKRISRKKASKANMRRMKELQTKNNTIQTSKDQKRMEQKMIKVGGTVDGFGNVRLSKKVFVTAISQGELLSAVVEEDKGSKNGKKGKKNKKGKHSISLFVWVLPMQMDHLESLFHLIGVQVLLLCHAPISKRVFFYFNTHNLNGRSFLRTDYTIEMGSQRWWDFLPVVLLVAVVYSIGLPVYLLTILLKYRHLYDNPKIKAKFGFLYERFSKGAELWEVHEIFRKMILCGMLVYAPPVTRASVASVVCLIAVATLNYYRAPSNKYVFIVASMAFLSTSMKYLSLIVLLTNNNNNNNNDTNDVIENDRYLMCLVLILLDVMVMVGGVLAVVACFCTMDQTTKIKNNQEHRSELLVNNTQVVPVRKTIVVVPVRKKPVKKRQSVSGLKFQEHSKTALAKKHIKIMTNEHDISAEKMQEKHKQNQVKARTRLNNRLHKRNSKLKKVTPKPLLSNNTIDTNTKMVEGIRSSVAFRLKTPKKLSKVFHKIDLDNSHTIDRDEFHALLIATLNNVELKDHEFNAVWVSALRLGKKGGNNLDLKMLKTWLFTTSTQTTGLSEATTKIVESVTTPTVAVKEATNVMDVVDANDDDDDGDDDGDDPFAKLDQQEEEAKEKEARKQQEDKHGDDDDDPFAKLDEQEEAEKERKTQQEEDDDDPFAKLDEQEEAEEERKTQQEEDDDDDDPFAKLDELERVERNKMDLDTSTKQ